MPATLTKILPSLVMVSVLGYLCWPYMNHHAPPNTKTAALPEIANDLLRPDVPAKTERDPFGASVRFELGEIREKPGYSRAPANKGAAPPQTRTPNTANTKPTGAPKTTDRPATAQQAAAGNRSGTSRTDKDQEKNSAKMPELTLNATVLHGTERIAYINDHAYHTGDKLADSTADTPMTIVEIRHHTVILDVDGTQHKLDYLDKESKTAGLLAQNAGRARPGQTPARRPGTPAAGAKRNTNTANPRTN